MEITSLGLNLDNIQLQVRSHNDQKLETHVHQEKASVVENLSPEKLNGRYIILQNQLNSLQYEYTREQTRLSLLELGMMNDEELVKVIYGKSPLFDESLDELIYEKSTLLEKIRSKKDQIKDQIEVIQIESDQVLPDKMKNPESYIKKLSLDKNEILKLSINKEEGEELVELEKLQLLKKRALEVRDAIKPFKDAYHIERLITG
jgi:hypothetical protein